jgi:hypothetical protein
MASGTGQGQVDASMQFLAWWNGVYPFVDYAGGGGIDGMIEVTNEMIARTTDHTVIVPAHAPVGNRRQPMEYRDMLVAIRNNVSDLKKQDKSLDDVIAIPRCFGGHVVAGFSDYTDGPTRLDVSTHHTGRGGDSARFPHDGQHDLGTTRHLFTPGRGTGPSERALHGGLFHRLRGRVGARRSGVRGGWVDACGAGRPCVSHRGTRTLHDGVGRGSCWKARPSSIAPQRYNTLLAIDDDAALRGVEENFWV